MKQDHDSSVFGVEAKDTGQPSVEGLIAELEAASEGRRFLDEEIHDAIHGGWLRANCVRGASGEWIHPEHGFIAPAPRYTTSIDGALPGEQIEVVSIQRAPPGHPQKWSALDANWPRNADGQYTCMRVAGIGHTEALARRIAALRARQAVPQADFGDKPQAQNTDESKNNNTGTTSDGGEG